MITSTILAGCCLPLFQIDCSQPSPLTLLTSEPNVTITANIRYRGLITMYGRKYWRFSICDKEQKCRDILVARYKE